MTTSAQNFTVYSGDDHEVTFTITDSAGDPQSLTGATSLKWQAFDGDTAVISKSLGSGVSLVNVDGTDDGVKVVIAGSDTDDLNGSYYHELEVVDVNSKTSTLAIGQMVVNPDRIT